MGREAVIGVPAGFGDIFWVYQKFYNYFDGLHFVVYMHRENHVERRSIPLIDKLPKVVSALAKVAGPRGPQPLFQNVYHMDEVMEGKGDYAEFEFGCNKWLELGNYLEDLDKEYQVAWNIEIPEEPLVRFWPEYVTLYVSGDTRHLGSKVWKINQWARFVDNYLKKVLKKDLPVLIIGADFDLEVQKQLCDLLTQLGIHTQVKTNLQLGELVYIFKNTEFFIGYQSGLNILADNCNTKQLMLYFPHLDKMRDTWVVPANRKNGVFKYDYFNKTPEEVLDKLISN